MSLAEEVPKALGLWVGLGIPLAVFNLTHTHESCKDTQVGIQTHKHIQSVKCISKTYPVFLPNSKKNLFFKNFLGIPVCILKKEKNTAGCRTRFGKKF